MPEEEILQLREQNTTARERVEQGQYGFIFEQLPFPDPQNEPQLFIKKTNSGVYINNKRVVE